MINEKPPGYMMTHRWKYGSMEVSWREGSEVLMKLFNMILDSEEMPMEWKKSVLKGAKEQRPCATL